MMAERGSLWPAITLPWVQQYVPESQDQKGDEMAHKVDLSWAARKRSNGEKVVPARGGAFDGTFDMLLTD
jgi:hypothetical protein